MRQLVFTAFANVWPTIRTFVSAYVIYKIIRSRYYRSRATPLAGPSHSSWLFGAASLYYNTTESSVIYEAWVQQFGSVFRVQGPFGSTRVILTDPRAVAHFYALNGSTYVWPRAARAVVENTFGRGLHALDGEEHAMRRRVVSAAFNPTFIQDVIQVYYDLAHKLKVIWDNQILSNDATVLDVQTWMERLALDAIGLTALSYDFKMLDGKQSAVTELFDAVVSVDRGSLD